MLYLIHSVLSLVVQTKKKKAQKKWKNQKYSAGREWCRKRLLKGELENDIIEIDVEPKAAPVIGMFAGSGMEDMSNNIQDMIGNLMPKKRKKRKVTVAQARENLHSRRSSKIIGYGVYCSRSY